MKQEAFLTTPKAIILGSVLISIAILVSGGIIKIGSKTSTQTVQPAASAQPTQKPIILNQVKDAFDKSQLKFGDANKKLVVLEIADPSCPYCSVASGENAELNKSIDKQTGRNQFTLVADGGIYVAPVPELKKLVDSGQAAFAYLYFPGHGNGEMATKALYCAFDLGKFWQVQDLIMNAKGYDLLNNTVKNDKTKSGDLADFLAQAADPTSMKACLDSGKYDSRLQTDTALAQSLGVSGTPGFFLNANLFPGAYNYKDMESTVKSALGI